MRTIKIFEPCETCQGTGLEWPESYAVECSRCQGHGENLVSVRKESIEDEQPQSEQCSS